MANLEIPGNLPGLGLLRPPPKREDKKTEKAGAGLFSRMFKVAEKEEAGLDGGEEWLSDPGQAAVDVLLDDVTALGDELKKNASLDAIKAYKQAVRRFMSKVVRDSYDTEEKVTGLGFKKRKKYTMIRVIDEKLERLAVGILQHQTEQMEILRRLDEIRGLLVDLIQ